MVAQAAHRVGEFRVEDQHLRAGVIEDVRDFPRGQSDVERDENGTDAHRPELRFEHLGYVRGQDRHAVAAAHARRQQGRTEPVDAVMELGVGIDPISMDHGRLVGIYEGAAFQER